MLNPGLYFFFHVLINFPLGSVKVQSSALRMQHETKKNEETQLFCVKAQRGVNENDSYEILRQRVAEIVMKDKIS